MKVGELEAENARMSADLVTLTAEYDSVKQQLDWLKRQLFGRKSEKQLDIDPALQGNLLADLGVATPPPPKDEPKDTITYQRRKKTRDAAATDGDIAIFMRKQDRGADPLVSAASRVRAVDGCQDGNTGLV